MAKPIIAVDLRDLHRLQATVAGIASDKAVLRDVAKGLAVASEVQTDRRFDRRQAPDGRPWAKRDKPAPHPILEKSGDLRRSVKGGRHRRRGGAEIRLALLGGAPILQAPPALSRLGRRRPGRARRAR